MAFDAAPSELNHLVTDCLVCPVQTCLGRRGPAQETAAWAAMLSPRVAVMPGAPPLFRAGDKQHALYSVRAGCIKTYTVDAEGNERIRGFYLPGDLIGLDVLGTGRWSANAVAVEPSQVCVAPVTELKRVLLAQPGLAQRLMEQTSRELAMALALAGDYSAEQRLAAFLLYMQRRLRARDNLLRLPMAQREIGSYLRLATETVCRCFKSFERKGWVAREKSALRLLNLAQLEQLAAPVGLAEPGLPLAA